MSFEKYERANKLIKESTKFKKTDINQAISLIKKAIETVEPDVDYSFHFKLARYLQIAGFSDQSFQVYQKLLLKKVNPDDVFLYNTNIYMIYFEICKFFYKEKKYLNYLNYYCLYLWNDCIAEAAKGHLNDIERLNFCLSDKNRFTESKNVTGCFKKLKKDSVKNDFIDRYYFFLTVHKDKFLNLYNISHKIQWIDSKKGNKYTPMESRPLRENNEYMKYYDMLNSIDFNRFYNDELGSLLK